MPKSKKSAKVKWFGSKDLQYNEKHILILSERQVDRALAASVAGLLKTNLSVEDEQSVTTLPDTNEPTPANQVESPAKGLLILKELLVFKKKLNRWSIFI
jgi:hypothetical protein